MEVTARITEILRLNYKQFKQLCMLAQGEFRRLLLAGSDERTEILRRLFDTGLYRTVQQELGGCRPGGIRAPGSAEVAGGGGMPPGDP